MELTFTCTVREIDGDYAMLLSGSGTERPVALALLPEDVRPGDTLIFENFEYRKA